jgi:2'-5' RNA ligase
VSAGDRPLPTPEPRTEGSPPSREARTTRPRPAPEPRTEGPPRPERPLRLFVALDLPAAAREALLAFAAAAADPEVWRPVTPDALHVTLAFLGPRPPADVAAIERVLAAESGGPAPRLALGDALLLPPRRARVLCADLEDPDGTLAALQARVSEGLAAAGVYTPEKRPFRAHATVARLRPRARAPRAVAAQPAALAFRGEAVTLYASRLHPSGARYEALCRAPLATRLADG